MATKLLHPQIPTSHVLPFPIPSLPKLTRSHSQRPPSTNHQFILPKSNFAIKVAESSSSLVGNQEDEVEIETDGRPVDYSANARLKTEIYNTLEGYNRGIFGIPSEKKSEIEDMVKVLESLNPNPLPTLDLHKLGGCWKLIYSTITILGSRRTKLGLRDFISLGDFLQIIDIDKVDAQIFHGFLVTLTSNSLSNASNIPWLFSGNAVNVIMFNVRGLNLFSGKLIIEASFKISSKSRVDISYNTSTIIPDQLMNMFRKNYDILLGIFNPDGWLEITYVDDTLRIGRDDKGNIFILERSNETTF